MSKLDGKNKCPHTSFSSLGFTLSLRGFLKTPILLGSIIVVGWYLVFSSHAAGGAQADIDWPQLSLELEGHGFKFPVHITHAGDGSGRLFVVERAGMIRILSGNTILEPPFLDITDRVRCCDEFEQGLFSVAFPPQYARKGYFYVHYTDQSGDTRVSRFFVTEDSNRADPLTETVILDLEQPGSSHNGGQLAFGPRDGYLYAGLGDGGGIGDAWGNAQNPSSLLGKVLRIDVESGVSPYAIPIDNPFAQNPRYRGEIWAMGLRNPWRFSFDRQRGDLFIADVGQSLYEEVNFQSAVSGGGENYGWNVMEGDHCYHRQDCDSWGFEKPVVEYDHNLGCSVTGGMVYRGSNYPRMQGIYFYGDFCSGRIWGLQNEGGLWQNQLLYETSLWVTSFGEGEAGDLYVADYNGGAVYRIIDDPRPDLSTSTKIASSKLAERGDVLTYTITLTNTGDLPITNTILLTDTLPLGLEYIPKSLTSTWGTVSQTGDYLIWQGDSFITPTVQIVYQAQVEDRMQGILRNQADVNMGGHGMVLLESTVIVDADSIYLPIVVGPLPHEHD